MLTQYDAQNHLADLAARCSGTSVPTDSFVQRPPPAEVVGTPARRVETSVLLPILAAIAHREELLASYQSMRRPGPAKVWIAPHALASDGNRWHARSWCHSTGLFRDFVLTRIQKILKSRPASMFADADCEWNTYVDLVIKPRSGLTEGQRIAIESDFAMTDGKLMIQCRQALAFYQLRNLQLDRPPDLPAADQPLDLINRDELSGIIAAARKTARGHHFSHQPESGIRL